MNNLKIAAVVVTYNRKQLLLQCLTAIKQQTLKPHTVYIIDNASTDGTEEVLEIKGFHNSYVNNIIFKYINLGANLGGAGGFYNGMKMAAESDEKFDAVWVMDDDGIPNEDCLKNLSEYLGKYHFICPLVLSTENPERLAFPYNGKIYTKVEFLQKNSFKIIHDYGCPMNGILFSIELIHTIGYPIPELFIWGDETNYTIRAKQANFEIVTVTNAIHYHPQERMKFAKSIFGLKIVICPTYWRGYCHFRNTVYNNLMSKSKLRYIKIAIFYIKNVYYYLFIRKDSSWLRCFNDAFKSGFKSIPDRGYLKYMS